MAAIQKPFAQINAFAMQNGVVLGIWALLAQCAMVGSFTCGILSMVNFMMMLFTPIILFLLTKKFRRAVAPTGVFTITQGFLHTLLTTIYASTWVAIGVYIYLSYVDNGYLFDEYVAYFNRPEVVELLSQKEVQQELAVVLQGLTLEEVINGLRSVPPATYSMMVFYGNLMVSPLLSLVIAIFLRRTK
jgi:hypothetical protein